MTVRRKIFLAMASFIVAMSVVFVLLTHFVVKASLEYIKAADRSNEIAELSELFRAHYAHSGDSWENVENDPGIKRSLERHRNTSLLLISASGGRLYSAGGADEAAVRRLGLSNKVKTDGDGDAMLYYYDPEVANLSKIQIGISSSVTVLLTFGTILFVLAALLVALWLAKRLTRPLHGLVQAIEQLGSGRRGVQAPVKTKDEYGRVASAFNAMSERLLAAEDVRRKLVADVAHELRTPITIVRGKLDLIQQSGRAFEPESLLPLQDELIRLTRLVDDLHQLSLAEAKKLPFERKPTHLPELTRRIVERVEPDAVSKQIAVKLICRTDTPEISIDPNRTTQVFLNLVVNAVKYTPEGGTVTITVEDEPVSAAGAPMLKVTVSDTGEGIRPEHLPYIFDRFYRTDEARSRNSGGMGLGLAIAREYVVAQGGTIEAASVPGGGTSFTVRLPR